MGATAANPLSLAVPDAAFEGWLRDSGYLQLLDLHTPAAPSTAAAPAAAAGAVSIARAVAAAVFSNAFAKLAAEDFGGATPRWTVDFVGPAGAYGWPTSPAQARLRVQENVRRYARNYAAVALLVFACCLYRMPVALLGMLSCLAVWEAVRYCNERWQLEEKLPGVWETLLRIAQTAAAVVLFLCNLQFAVVYALGVSYTILILHATFRKLTPLTQHPVVPQPKISQLPNLSKW